jgi:hypothetical protein
VRYWTPEEANAALPHVAALLERVREATAELRARAETIRERAGGNGHAQPADAAERVLREVAAELAADGIILRDAEAGLIDFPARAGDGRPYWLCWRSGEDRVAWWHWPEDGFAGRRPLGEAP